MLRKPIPRRSLPHAEKKTLPLNEQQLGVLFGAITRAAHLDRNAKRDYVLIKGVYLLGCRVSEIAAIRCKDIEMLSDGGRIHLFGKGSKARTVRVSSDTLELFSRLAAVKLTAMYFQAPVERDTSLDKRLEMYAASGDEPLASTFTRTN